MVYIDSVGTVFIYVFIVSFNLTLHWIGVRICGAVISRMTDAEANFVECIDVSMLLKASNVTLHYGRGEPPEKVVTEITSLHF